MSTVPSRRRFTHVVTAYAAVVMLYVVFFAYPVSPAHPQGTFDFVIEEREYADIPNIHETVYTNGKAFLVIATIRTIAAPDSAYSLVFERIGDYAEKFVRDNYGVEVDVREESTDGSYAVAGHVGVRFIFGIYKSMSIGDIFFPTSQDVKVAEMGAIAWFCNVDFESVVAFYVTPLYFFDDPLLQALSDEVFSMVDGVACH